MQISSYICMKYCQVTAVLFELISKGCQMLVKFLCVNPQLINFNQYTRHTKFVCTQ